MIMICNVLLHTLLLLHVICCIRAMAACTVFNVVAMKSVQVHEAVAVAVALID